MTDTKKDNIANTLDNVFSYENFLKDEIIFEEGDSSGELYIVDKGEVRISKIINGEKIVVATLGDGEVFGDLSLIKRGSPRSATVEAVVETDCYVMHADDFYEQLSEISPLLCGIVGSLADRLAKTTDMLAAHIRYIAR